MESKSIRKGNGHGYYKEDGTIGMQRCFECGEENHAFYVHSGVCAWCWFDANAREDTDGN